MGTDREAIQGWLGTLPDHEFRTNMEHLRICSACGRSEDCHKEAAHIRTLLAELHAAERRVAALEAVLQKALDLLLCRTGWTSEQLDVVDEIDALLSAQKEVE